MHPIKIIKTALRDTEWESWRAVWLTKLTLIKGQTISVDLTSLRPRIISRVYIL